MLALWFRDDVEALARRQGMRPPEGRMLQLGCHPGAGFRADVHKETQGRPCATVCQLLCYQCHTPIVDIAGREPVMTPRRCGHRLGPALGYLRGEIILFCPSCDQACFLARVARRQDFWGRG